MKRLFGKKKKGEMSEDMALNITAMADVFTVILVFLLKSYATGSVNLTPTAGLSLPEAQADVPQFEALKIEVAADAVLVENQPVAKLISFEFPAQELSSDGTSKTLSKSLELQRKRQTLIAKVNSDVKVDSKVLIVADQRVPYSTLKAVLASAATQGYTDFKLAVIQAEKP